MRYICNPSLPRPSPCPDGGIGRRAGLKIQCPLKTCGFEPRSGHENEYRQHFVASSASCWRFSIYLPSCLRSRAREHLHVTPPLNPLPRGGDFRAQMGPSTPAAKRLPQGATGGRPPDPLPSSFSGFEGVFPFHNRSRACIGPIGGPIRAIFALFARMGPADGPVRAPFGETRKESDSQHAVSDKNGPNRHLRDAPARQR